MVALVLALALSRDVPARPVAMTARAVIAAPVRIVQRVQPVRRAIRAPGAVLRVARPLARVGGFLRG